MLGLRRGVPADLGCRRLWRTREIVVTPVGRALVPQAEPSAQEGGLELSHGGKLEHLDTEVVGWAGGGERRRSVRYEGEGNEGVERAAPELEPRPAVASIIALPELAVAETGKEATVGGEERVGHRR